VNLWSFIALDNDLCGCDHRNHHSRPEQWGTGW